MQNNKEKEKNLQDHSLFLSLIGTSVDVVG
jgi:hypothetical protein